MKGKDTVLSFPTMGATIYLFITRKSSRRVELLLSKVKRSSTKLGKAKRTVLVPSMYGYVEVKYHIVKTTNFGFPSPEIILKL